MRRLTIGHKNNRVAPSSESERERERLTEYSVRKIANYWELVYLLCIS